MRIHSLFKSMGVEVKVFDNGVDEIPGDTLVQVDYENPTAIPRYILITYPIIESVGVEIPAMEKSSKIINTPSLDSMVSFS
jgi:hypothetical protein